MKIKNFLLGLATVSLVTGCSSAEITSSPLDNSLISNSDQNAQIQSAKATDKKKSAFLTDSLSMTLHNNWRADRRLAAGGGWDFQPSTKVTKDYSWIKAHNGETKVDIANTNYAQLPADLQAEYKIPAQVAVDLLLIAIDAKKNVDKTFIEEGSKKIYSEVLKSTKSSSSVSYAKLSEKNKETYRAIMKEAVQLVKDLNLLN